MVFDLMLLLLLLGLLLLRRLFVRCEHEGIKHGVEDVHRLPTSALPIAGAAVRAPRCPSVSTPRHGRHIRAVSIAATPERGRRRG